MEVGKRKTVWDNLNKYDTFAKEGDFIEVTEWTNEEGFDINIKDTVISLTRGEIEAIYYLKTTLDNDVYEETK